LADFLSGCSPERHLARRSDAGKSGVGDGLASAQQRGGHEQNPRWVFPPASQAFSRSASGIAVMASGVGEESFSVATTLALSLVDFSSPPHRIRRRQHTYQLVKIGCTYVQEDFCKGTNIGRRTPGAFVGGMAPAK
jgi:hypothetical protein